MSHEMPATPENKPEHIPSMEEIISVLKRLTEKEPTITRKREDEKGLYLLEVTVPGEDEGEVIEYAYMRPGTFPEGSNNGKIGIEFTLYEGGMPTRGATVAIFVGDTWELVP